MKLIVYGTLRKGGVFEKSLYKGHGAKFIETKTIKGIAMYKCTDGDYPGAIITGKRTDQVKADIIEVTDETLARLDILEGTRYGYYNRVKFGDYYIYVAGKCPLDRTIKIEDWIEYVNKKVSHD